jgi:two-component system osmolarity sensor histidine kinase EnvZ
MAADIEEIDRMLGQFLHYVRAGYQEVPRAAVADEVVAEVARTAAHPEDIVLELDAGARQSLPVDCLRHSVMNLLRNALEYGKTPVRVRTSQDRGTLTVAVRDEGAGLSEEDWLKALKPFQRLQERGESASTHSGLGLALVERLVHMSQGSIEAKRLNPGFEVRIRLPAGEVT